MGKAERVKDDLVFIIYLPFTKVGKSVEGMGWGVNIKKLVWIYCYMSIKYPRG